MTDTSKSHDALRQGARSPSPVAGPALASPQLLSRPKMAAAGAVGIFGLVLGLAAAGGWLGEASSPTQDRAAAPPSAQRLVHEVPGFIQAIDPVLANGSPHVFAALIMPEDEKNRLKAALARDGVRIGAITLWDTVDEDGDIVRIDGAGFGQDLTILHKPATFFVPFLPGGNVTLTAVRDGGGGVTLGVATTFGPVPLPRLAVGTVLEVPLP